MISVQVTYRVYEERTKRGMSTRDLEKLSGVSKTHINAIENNKTHPTVYTLLLLAAAMHVAPQRLFRYEVSDI